MKVLHALINAPTYSSIGIEKGFRENGFDYVGFDWQHSRFSNGVEAMRKEFIKLARKEEPDWIFMHIQNSDAIDLSTAEELSDMGTLINFTEDVRDDISWYRKLGFCVDLTVFSNKEDVAVMKLYGYRSAYIPTSYNDIWFNKQPKSKSYGDIIFLGSNYLTSNLNFPQAQERYDMVQFMKSQFGERFQVYGRDWGTRTLNPQESVQAYNNCKIAITHSNFKRAGYTSDRLFNSLGCGAFTIAQYYEGCEEHFENKLITWDNFKQLKYLCISALQNDYIREKNAAELHQIVQAKHQWKNRIAEIMSILNK